MKNQKKEKQKKEAADYQTGREDMTNRTSQGEQGTAGKPLPSNKR